MLKWSNLNGNLLKKLIWTNLSLKIGTQTTGNFPLFNIPTNYDQNPFEKKGKKRGKGKSKDRDLRMKKKI